MTTAQLKAHPTIAGILAGTIQTTPERRRAIEQRLAGRPSPVRRDRSTKAKARERVGTAMKARIEKLLTIRTGKGCGCQNLATEMDAWGIAGCELRRAHIVGHLVSNRDILVDALKAHGSLGHAAAVAVWAAPDGMLRAGADMLLTEAIEDVRKQQPPPVIRPPREPIVRRGDAWSLKGGRTTPTAKQNQQHAACMAAPPPSPDPFTDTPVFHFGGHLWPIRNNWQRHADAWNKLAEIITGQMVVGVVFDEHTDSFEVVRSRLHPKIGLFFEPNTPHGENPTFEKLRHMMPNGQNDIFLYAHGKGVRQRTFDSRAIDLWVDMMYRSVLFRHEKIVERMNAGYKMVGSFRMFGLAASADMKGWHYAGTFWALRAKYFPGGPVPQRYGGVECWPGVMFGAHETACEFLDNVAMRCLYLDSYMDKLKPTFEDWIAHNAPTGL